MSRKRHRHSSKSSTKTKEQPSAPKQIQHKTQTQHQSCGHDPRDRQPQSVLKDRVPPKPSIIADFGNLSPPLLRMVMDQLCLGDAYAASLVCRDWNDAAEDRLYEHIEMDGKDCLRYAFVRLAISVVQQERYAVRVQSISFRSFKLDPFDHPLMRPEDLKSPDLEEDRELHDILYHMAGKTPSAYTRTGEVCLGLIIASAVNLRSLMIDLSPGVSLPLIVSLAGANKIALGHLALMRSCHSTSTHRSDHKPLPINCDTLQPLLDLTHVISVALYNVDFTTMSERDFRHMSRSAFAQTLSRLALDFGDSMRVSADLNTPIDAAVDFVGCFERLKALRLVVGRTDDDFSADYSELGAVIGKSADTMEQLVLLLGSRNSNDGRVGSLACLKRLKGLVIRPQQLLSTLKGHDILAGLPSSIETVHFHLRKAMLSTPYAGATRTAFPRLQRISISDVWSYMSGHNAVRVQAYKALCAELSIDFAVFEDEAPGFRQLVKRSSPHPFFAAQQPSQDQRLLSWLDSIEM